MTVASCKATLAESTKAFAREHSPTDESDRLASRNQVVRKSTDVEEPAPFAAGAAAGAGDAGCCRTDGEDGNISNVNYRDICFSNLTFFTGGFFLQAGPLVGRGGVVTAWSYSCESSYLEL